MASRDIIWFLAGTVLPAALVALLCGFIVRRVAPKFGLVDKPAAAGHKTHVRITPLGGGLAIWLAVVLPLALGQLLLWFILRGDAPPDWLPEFAQPHLAGLWQQSNKLWILLLAATVLMALGLIDDARGLNWRIRLFVQALVASLVVFGQGWQLTLFLDSHLLTGALSVLWVVALINAFNMLDNMDGLSAGVAAIAASMLAALLLMAQVPNRPGPQLFVAGLLLLLVGALAGFLWHNRSPARLFMGDAGSYFIGFLLGATTLMGTYTGYEKGTSHAVLAPLCVLAIPLYDMLSVIVVRLRQGRSPFEGDRNHFSHRLVELGLSRVQAVWTIYLATAACGLGALVLHRVDRLGAAAIIGQVGCILVLIAILETFGRRRNGSAER